MNIPLFSLKDAVDLFFMGLTFGAVTAGFYCFWVVKRATMKEIEYYKAVKK